MSVRRRLRHLWHVVTGAHHSLMQRQSVYCLLIAYVFVLLVAQRVYGLVVQWAEVSDEFYLFRQFFYALTWCTIAHWFYMGSSRIEENDKKHPKKSNEFHFPHMRTSSIIAAVMCFGTMVIILVQGIMDNEQDDFLYLFSLLFECAAWASLVAFFTGWAIHSGRKKKDTRD